MLQKALQNNVIIWEKSVFLPFVFRVRVCARARALPYIRVRTREAKLIR